MKSMLISALAVLSLVSIAYCSSSNNLDAEYVAKIIEMAQANGEKIGVDEPLAREELRFPSLSCSPMNPPAPTTIHALAPHHVKVLGAIGDSLTAGSGAGASSILGLLTEYRGDTWTMGGNSLDITKSITFPSCLAQFSKTLYGYSVGSGSSTSAEARLNVAVPGDTSFEMQGQARILVNRMIADPKVNVASDWKVVNFFIGGNDLCKSCKDAKYSAANYVSNIRETLFILKQGLPRTLVNLILTLDVTGVRSLEGVTCTNMQKSFCECALSDSYLPTLKALTYGYQKGVEDLVNSGIFDTDEQFTVVIHPFMKLMTPPLGSDGKGDKSYFAPDCFHFSIKGHNEAGKELWNAFMTPPNQKNEVWTVGSGVKCPNPSFPYIPTNKNSKNFH